jgi:hypothetical protein
LAATDFADNDATPITGRIAADAMARERLQKIRFNQRDT